MERYCNGCDAGVPLAVHEKAMARAERTTRRLCVVILILVLLIFASNLAWVLHENSVKDEIVTEEERDVFA